MSSTRPAMDCTVVAARQDPKLSLQLKPAQSCCLQAQLGDVTWRSAPAASHGGVAYFGAWVAVQPTTAEVMFRVSLL